MQIAGSYAVFPVMNATLNGISAALLLYGHSMMQRGNIRAHRNTMIAAVSASVIFLISYLYYHAHVGSIHFQGQGWARRIYLAILISHTILAVVIVPLIVITLYRGLRERFDKHRRIARWTYPLWLYVNITGVIVYFMLYQIYAAA